MNNDIKKLTKFGNKLLGESYEDRSFSTTTLLCTILTSLLFLPLNNAVVFPLPHTISVIAYIVTSFGFYILFLFKIKLKILFLLSSFVALMIVWFFNGGTNGSMGYFFMSVFAGTIIILRKKKRIIMGIIFSIIVTLALLLEEFKIIIPPNPYLNDEARILDHQLSIYSTLIIISVILWTLTRNFDKERKHQVDEILDLTKISYTDKLTSCYNRRYFEHAIPKEIHVCQELGQESYGIMMDIDFFKKVNDTFGHDKGDEVLIVTSQIIRSTVRRSDLLFRLGGEEFFLFLPNTNRENAFNVGEKVRKKIQEIFEQTDYKSTISMGACRFNNKESVDSWIKRTDENLYVSKQTGRNRLTIT